MNDGLGDWRIAAATQLAQDIPAAYLGGPSHKAGAAVYQHTHVKVQNGDYLGFVIPSATAMALNVAIKGSNKALELRGEIVFDDGVTPDGPGKSVSDHKLASLYDFFEQCMIAVTFSFQALETFSNQQIGTKLQGKIRLRRRNETREYSSEEIERKFSTEEKLGTVLPLLLHIPTLQGTTIWNQFLVLKSFRDACVHLKTKDQYSAQTSEDDLLFYKFLNADITSMPTSAVNIIKYFFTNQEEPRWLKAVKT